MRRERFCIYRPHSFEGKLLKNLPPCLGWPSFEGCFFFFSMISCFLSRVFTDLQQVLQNLTHSRFEFTNSEQEADILYNFSHFKDYRLQPFALQVANLLLTCPSRSPRFAVLGTPLVWTASPPSLCRKLSEERPHVMLNQFPCENLLTVKDCLASVSRRVGGSEGPKWLPRTFNLLTELPQFISYFQQRERRWAEINRSRLRLPLVLMGGSGRGVLSRFYGRELWQPSSHRTSDWGLSSTFLVASKWRRQPLDMQTLEPGEESGHPHHQELEQHHPAEREHPQGQCPEGVARVLWILWPLTLRMAKKK